MYLDLQWPSFNCQVLMFLKSVNIAVTKYEFLWVYLRMLAFLYIFVDGLRFYINESCRNAFDCMTEIHNTLTYPKVFMPDKFGHLGSLTLVHIQGVINKKCSVSA